MKKILYGILLLVVISCASRKADENTYSISMNLTGFQDSTKFRVLDLDRLEFVDSAYSFNGKLEFKGYVTEPFNARIHTIDNKYVVLWIEPGDIKIQGSYDDFNFSTIEGTPLNSVMVKYRDKQRTLHIRRDSLMQKIIQAISSHPEEASALIRETNLIDKKVFDIRVDGILSEEPSYHTMKELYFLRNDFSRDTLNLYFQRFPKSFQNTKYGEVIRTYLDHQTPTVGHHYTDIEGLNTTGHVMKLSAFEGKYVLLDFWASWCAPCRAENPNLVKAYQDFHDKGFEIFSFSTDNNVVSWKKAIQKDSLHWTNVIDTTGSYSTMSALYGVRGIPSSFLINPEGIIIAKDLRGKALREKLEKELKIHGL
jgi:peroxiredoxin